MQVLKPLDLVVALKIGLNERKARESFEQTGLRVPLGDNSVGNLAASLGKGKGDISRAINRLTSLQLIAERRPKEGDVISVNRKYYSLQRQAMSDFLCFGVRHVFAPAKTGVGRGVPTGWNCPLIKSPMNPPEIPLVWSMPGGSVNGELIEPLYPQCPEAALKDEDLYSLLSLVEILRTGKPRELKYAKELIDGKVKELYS